MNIMIGSGQYEPVITAPTDVIWEPPEALAPFLWKRVGRLVTVIGHFRFGWNYYPEPTISTPEAVILISLPVSPTGLFGSSWQCGGSCAIVNETLQLGKTFPVLAEGGGPHALVQLTTGKLFNPREYALHFTYAISWETP